VLDILDTLFTRPGPGREKGRRPGRLVRSMLAARRERGHKDDDLGTIDQWGLDDAPPSSCRRGADRDPLPPIHGRDGGRQPRLGNIGTTWPTRGGGGRTRLQWGHDSDESITPEEVSCSFRRRSCQNPPAAREAPGRRRAPRCPMKTGRQRLFNWWAQTAEPEAFNPDPDVIGLPRPNAARVQRSIRRRTTHMLGRIGPREIRLSLEAIAGSKQLVRTLPAHQTCASQPAFARELLSGAQTSRLHYRRRSSGPQRYDPLVRRRYVPARRRAFMKAAYSPPACARVDGQGRGAVLQADAALETDDGQLRPHHFLGHQHSPGAVCFFFPEIRITKASHLLSGRPSRRDGDAVTSPIRSASPRRRACTQSTSARKAQAGADQPGGGQDIGDPHAPRQPYLDEAQSGPINRTPRGRRTRAFVGRRMASGPHPAGGGS